MQRREMKSWVPHCWDAVNAPELDTAGWRGAAERTSGQLALHWLAAGIDPLSLRLNPT